MKINNIRQTMFARPDPVIFRIIAFVAAIGVAGFDMALAGTWWAMLVAGGLVAAACMIFPAKAPQDDFRKNILHMLRAVRCSSLWLRAAPVTFLILVIAVLDFFYGPFELGREFNIFLIPIFLTSLFFGLPVAILAWLLSFLVVYFSVIPPKFSFAISEPKDLAELVSFFYLGLIMLTVPVLIRASAVTET